MPLIYDPFMAPLERLGLARWRARVAGPATGRVLDIGTGTGLNLPYFTKADEVIALDPDAAMLRRARQRAKRIACPVHLVSGSAEALPFPNGAFNTVVICLALCTIPDPGAAFDEVHRVLAPGGTLPLLEHVRSSYGWQAALQDLLTPGWKCVAGGCHLNRPTMETALLHGFTPVNVRRGLSSWLLAATLRPTAGER